MEIKKGLLVVAFLSIILVCLSFVSATKYDSSGNIVGACTGPQTCFCSGRAVDCPCDADPCVICGPTSPECTRQTGAAQAGTSSGTTDTEVVNTQNPQTFEDYAAVLANGIGNLFRTSIGNPIIVGGKLQTSVPTAEERAVAIFTTITLLTAFILILKSILKKILMAGKPMNAARPSYFQMKIRPPTKPTPPCVRRKR